MHLSPEQCRQFRETGFLHLQGCWPAGAFDALRSELTAIIDHRAQDLQATGRLTELHSAAPFSQRFGLLHAQCPAIADGFDIQPLLPTAVFALTHHPALLETLRPLLGQEISCNPIQHLRSKPPVTDNAAADQGFFTVPWHQDAAVTTPDADGALLITAWTPIGEASEAMGCLQVIPGIREYLPHVRSDYGTTIDPRVLDESAAVSLPCREGDVILMDQFTPHRSTANRSDRCRWSLDLRFQQTGTASGRAWYPSHVVASDDPTSIERDVDRWRARWTTALAQANPGVVHRVMSATT